MRADADFLPWLDAIRGAVPGLALFDVHTHVGQNDPDGFSCTPAELEEALALAGARAAVFPMQEPAGYRAANDFVLEAAAGSGGTLVPFCRVDPATDPVAEATRCLDAGARGIKLHPRAERFTLDHPGVQGIVALAAERRVPVLIHAGRGIPALGEHTLSLAAAHPAARLILAHAAVSDLAWLWRELPSHPNVLIDTSWWGPSDLLALFELVPPGQVVWASDLPYGTAVVNAVLSLRCALQAGLTPEQVRGVAGGQSARLVAGEDLLALGPAPGARATVLDPHLDRIASYLAMAVGRMSIGATEEGAESLSLARLACDPYGGPLHDRLAELIAAAERAATAQADHHRFAPGLDHTVVAAVLARTPDVPF